MGDEAIRKGIQSRRIRTTFQPVVNLSDLSILGFEALSRGPANTELESAEGLFEATDRARLRRQLEQLCRNEALVAARGLSLSCKLFLNVSARSLGDSNLLGSTVGTDDQAIGPQQIVLELSERFAVEDYNWFRSVLRSLSGRGFEVALDNLGRGHAGLDRLVELGPAFFKLDRSMVKRVQESVVKKEMIEALQAMSQRCGARMIAQGIETSEELQCLRRMNVELGQGFVSPDLARSRCPPSASHVGRALLESITPSNDARCFETR